MMQNFEVIQTFSHSFKSYLKNWWVHVLLGLTFLFLPMLVGGGILAAMAGSFLMAAKGGAFPAAGLSASVIIGFILFYIIIFFASAGLAGASTHASIQSLAGRELRIGDSIKVGLSKIVTVFLLFLLVFFVTLLGAIPGGVVAGIGGVMKVGAIAVIGVILVYVGMVFVGLGLFVAVPVKVAENKGIMASVSRSWALSAGYRWQILGLTFLFAIAIFVVMIVGLLLNFIPILGQIIFFLLMLAIMPFGSFMAAAAYQRLVEIKEGKSVTSVAEVFS
jgi:hypothetical protein